MVLMEHPDQNEKSNRLAFYWDMSESERDITDGNICTFMAWMSGYKIGQLGIGGCDPVSMTLVSIRLKK